MQNLYDAQIDRPTYESHDVSERAQVKFLAKDYQLLARNYVSCITIPAANREMLNAQIRSAFKSLNARQGSNPVIVGAIPFDTRQPSSLHVYSDYELRSEELSTGKSYTDEKGSEANEIEKITRVVDESSYSRSVTAALKAISNNDLEKVVLAQSQKIQFTRDLDAEPLLSYLRKHNPNAYIFSVPVGANSIFLGASPELLLSKRGRHVFSNPLAGSISRSDDSKSNEIKSNNLQGSGKDNHEHRIVVEDIAQNMARHCVELSISEHPSVLATNTMLHLSSTLKGYLRGDAPDALNIALDLHPTPAICGSPTEAAKNFILQNEEHDRGFYAGLVGWMDASGNGDWAVSIRCGLLAERQLNVFAGAGVVAGSDPSAEWLETEFKLKTLMNILRYQ